MHVYVYYISHETNMNQLYCMHIIVCVCESATYKPGNKLKEIINKDMVGSEIIICIRMGAWPWVVNLLMCACVRECVNVCGLRRYTRV